MVTQLDHMVRRTDVHLKSYFHAQKRLDKFLFYKVHPSHNLHQKLTKDPIPRI